MRIGLIRMRYTPYGGAETFLRRFIAELLKRGHTIEVFSSEWEGGGGTNVHRVKTFGPSFLRPLVFALRAGKEVDRVRPDVVLSLERTFCQDIYRAGDGCHREWLRRRGATVSWFKRLLIALSPLHAVLLYMEKRLFQSGRLKKVVANSMMVRDDIKRHYGLPDEKIYVIYNGIEAPSFADASMEERRRVRRDLGLQDGSTLLLFVGSGFERKGLMYLIRAVALLKEKGDVRLVVAGKGNASRYQKEARRLGVEGQVMFKGPVKDVLSYYKAGDIFVLPSIYEPFSNACLEAMAAGLPVVTSRANGASEVIADGVNGAVIEDPTDSFEIAQRITPFLDVAARVKAGRLARAEALKYPIEKNVDEFLKLLDDTGQAEEKGI